MDIYERMKNEINKDMRDFILDVMNKKDIPHDLDSTRTEDYFLTIFVTNCDLTLPKKLRTKHRLANPAVDITFTAKRSFDYNAVVNIHNNKNTPLFKLMYMYSMLRDTSWHVPVSRAITAWARSMFSALMIMYRDKYGIKLARMPFEVWIDTPSNMLVTKIPCFEDLTFVSNDSSPKVIDTKKFIRNQADIIDAMRSSGFLGKNDTK